MKNQKAETHIHKAETLSKVCSCKLLNDLKLLAILHIPMYQTGVNIMRDWVFNNRIEKQGSPRISILVRPIAKVTLYSDIKGNSIKKLPFNNKIILVLVGNFRIF